MQSDQTIEKATEQIGVGTCVITERAKQYVGQVLASNRLTYGPFSRALEEKFARAHDCKFAIFVNSGTSALRIALAALKEKYNWHDGDEVLIPTITFIADVNVILHNKLQPVFVDVDERTYNIDPAKIEEKITSRTRAIMPSHLFGMAANMAPIERIAEAHDLAIVEDACESAFTRYQNRPVGAFGDIACFSTYQAHILTTGVGGFALTNDAELAVLLRSLANHGRDGIYMQIDDDKGKSDQELKEIVQRRFSFIRPGYSFRATELEAALGLAEMEDGVVEQIKKRKTNAEELVRVLGKWETVLQLPIIPPGHEHVFMMFPLVIKKGSGIDRDALVTHLELYNIETRRMLPILDQPFIVKMFGDLSGQFPIADHINKNGFYIASHPSLTADQISYVGRVFDAFLGS